MSKKAPAGEAHAIVVGIRVRPFNQRELKYNSTCVVSMEGNCTRIHEISNGKVLMGKPREFVFDYAFWTHSKDGSGAPAPAAGTAPPAPPPFADQQYVYERLGVQIVQNVFEGFNSCLFAYGQTGSGKTYSMMGTATDPGMLPRIGTDIFERGNAFMAAGNEFSVKASFCELYNEKCRDLLATTEVGKDGKPVTKGDAELKIRMHPQTGVFVEGITSYTLKSPEEYFKLLERGLSHRTTASTNMNATSSRSHGIVLLTVFQKDYNGSKTGKMSLVDLAGSERMAATGATGATAVEGQNINRSLTTLGMVLSKLAEKATSSDKSAAQSHVPYRDSQLTFLLMDNLGGNSKTSMIAAISPASVNYDETLSTLRFSSVAKKVKSVATVNEDPNDKLIRELKTELGELKDRLRRLQEQRKSALAAASPNTTSQPASPTPAQPAAPPPSGEIIDAKAFPTSGTPPPTPQPVSPNTSVPQSKPTPQKSSSSGTPSSNTPPPEPQSPSYSTAAATLAHQIEEDEGALKSLTATPHTGAELLEDPNDIRVHLTKVPSVVVGNVAAPNPILLHQEAPISNRSISLPPHNDGSYTTLHASGPASLSSTRKPRSHALEDSFALGGTADSIVLSGSETRGGLVADASIDLTVGQDDRRRRQQEEDEDNEEANAAMLAAANRSDSDIDLDELEDELEPGSPKREVMVDWRAPQLINLRPEAGGDVLIIPLPEGVTECEMDDVQVFFNFDALAGHVTIYSSLSSAVFLNGVEIEDEGNVLRHNDRIVVGENAFRFAYTAQDAPDFKTTAVSIEHIILLERYDRMKIVEERSKNALSMGKAYFTTLSAITKGSVKAPAVNMTPRGGSGMTPRSTNPLLAAIGDDSSYTNQLVYELEKQLAEEYPADAQDVEEQVTVDLSDYTEAIDERARMVQQRQDEVEHLKELLERQNKLATQMGSPDRADTSEEAVVQESINAACSETVLQKELLWHRQVKNLKTFRSVGGPSDPVDALIWQRLSSDPPFACDAMLKLDRSLVTSISDPKTSHGGSRKWALRFIACSRQFMFIFRHTSDVLPALGAVYLPGATITTPNDRASLFADPTDLASSDNNSGDRAHPAPKYYVEIAPAISRSPEDNSVSSHQCALKIGFDDEATMLSWRQFFEECSSPAMPLSMLKRWTKEFVAHHGTISVFVDPAVSTFSSASELVPDKMKWKPDNSVDACEDCKKPFKLIIRGRHHCRGCGGIFCADCLEGKGDAKKCENCRFTVKRNARRAAVAGLLASSDSQPCRRTNILSEFELRNPHLLREVFKVKIEIVSNPRNAESVRRLNVPAEAISAAVAAGVSSEFHFDEDGVVRFQIDHYRDRAHTFTGDEILRLERSLFVQTILLLHTTDGAVVKLSFEDAMARERCIESLFVLMGCRVYMPGLRDVVEISNVVVTNEVGEDCFFRMTNNIAVDAKLWVGMEDGRSIPFHDNYAVWAFVGHKETWNEGTLKMFRLCLLEQAQLAKDTYLYVVCTLEWKQNIMAVSACPVDRSAKYTIGAIGLRLLESSVLFVGVLKSGIQYDDFVDVHDGSPEYKDKLFSLGHISTTNLPIVDTLQQYDHVFLINSPGLPQFLQATPVVHYSSPTVEVLLAGRTSVEMVMPCVGFSCSKFCDHPSERPVFKIEAITILSNKGTDDGKGRNESPKAENLLPQCQLWCSMGFDRLHNGVVVTDPTILHALGTEASEAYREIMLVNSMAEYCSLGKLFIVCSDLGSVAINIAQVMAQPGCTKGTSTPVACEIMRGGKVSAIAEVVINARWVAGYSGIESKVMSRKESAISSKAGH